MKIVPFTSLASARASFPRAILNATLTGFSPVVVNASGLTARSLTREGVSRMGRGRQKAKHTKIARELKAYSPSVNYSALERELAHPDRRRRLRRQVGR